MVTIISNFLFMLEFNIEAGKENNFGSSQNLSNWKIGKDEIDKIRRIMTH